MSAIEQACSQVLFVEAINFEIVHFLGFNRRRNLWEFFCCEHVNICVAIFVNIDGHRTWGRVKRVAGI